MNEPAPDTLRTRASLIERVKNLDDAHSWSEFFAAYDHLVRSYAARCNLRPHEVEDVAQEVFKRIARTIHDFHPGERPGSFRNWLRRLTRWRAGDVLRDRDRARDPEQSSPQHDDATPLVERIAAPADPAMAFESEARQHLLGELFRRLDGKVSPRHLQIFQVLVIENVPVERVAEIYGMSHSNLYVLRHRVLEKLRAEARRVPLAWE